MCQGTKEFFIPSYCVKKVAIEIEHTYNAIRHNISVIDCRASLTSHSVYIRRQDSPPDSLSSFGKKYLSLHAYHRKVRSLVSQKFDSRDAT